MGVIVISLGTPRSGGQNFECTWKHLGAPVTSLEVPVTSLEAPATSLGALATRLGAPTTSLRVLARTLGAPQIPVEQSGKTILGNAEGVPGNHSYYLLFNDC
jgi:hypothetical protein